jgi:protein-S-isoprenylcysteine O-methyltransferase Ste14
MMSGLLTLILLHALFSKWPLVIGVQAVALLIFLWSRITFGRRSYHVGANPTKGGLVMTGPYRVIRHPIYAAFCLFTAAGTVAHLSWKTGLALALIFVSALIRIYSEETLVSIEYPEYQEYVSRTWRMVPGLF